MANTLTGLTPEAEIRVLEVARETSAMIRMVTNNVEDLTVPVGRGETVDINVMNDFTAASITPGIVTPAAGNDIEPTTPRLTLDQHYGSSFLLTTKEAMKIAAGQSEALDSAVRAVVNQINGSLTGLYIHVGQHEGTAGTTPFASDTDILRGANVKLSQSRAPKVTEQRSVILDPLGYGNATQLSVFQDVDRSGLSETLRDAMISRGVGYLWAEDQLIASHDTSASGNYAADAAGSIGDTTLVVDDAAGALPTALVPGDLFTIAGSTKQYSVVTYTAGATEATILLSEPLDQAVADGDALTVVTTDHTANLAFHRQAFHLAIRPEDQVDLSVMGINDGRSDMLSTVIIDEQSGIPLTLMVFKQYHQTWFEVSALWGVVCARPNFAVRLLG